MASAHWKEAPNFKTGRTFKFKVNFITLTLPAPQRDVTDKELKAKALDQFIKRCRRKYELKSYVWRAERQGNGNLHFHLVTDCWIHYEKLRNDWNDVLGQFHFIKEFEAKHPGKIPNSTDVHSTRDVRDLSAYLTKYMSKDEITQEQARNVPFAHHRYALPKPGKKGLHLKRCKTETECTIDGKVWDCSTNLKLKQNCEMLLEGNALDTFNRASEDPEVGRKIDPLFTCLFLKPDQFAHYIKNDLREKWEAYLQLVRSG